MKKYNTPKSVIDKWLHYDRNITRKSMCELLGIDPRSYSHALEAPRKHFTAEHMAKISAITKKDIAVVFWACFHRPINSVIDNDKERRKIEAVERIIY